MKNLMEFALINELDRVDPLGVYDTLSQQVHRKSHSMTNCVTFVIHLQNKCIC